MDTKGSAVIGVGMRSTAYLIRVPEAARITGLPASLIRKSFICEEKRPINVPPPPPHKRVGRSVYIVADKLAGWVESLDDPLVRLGGKRRRGRPTVGERIAHRQ
jgi:hypothetical protein